MRLFILTLTLFVLATACHRRAIPPQTITETKDSVVYKETYKDTTIYIPGSKVIVRDTVKAPCPKWDYDTVAVKDNVRLHVNISKGHLTASCEADSLKKVISILSSKLQNFQTKTITVPVPVKVPVRYIPKWVWWLLGLTLMRTVYDLRHPLLSIIKSRIR